MDANENTCHGCHKSGHYISKCAECYKCQYCYKHHVKGKSCPSNHLSGEAVYISAHSASIAADASIPSRISDPSNEKQRSREFHFSYDTPPDRLGTNHGDDRSAKRGTHGSSPLQIDRNPYSNLSSPPNSSSFNRSLASQYQHSLPLLPPQQKQRQQHTYQAEGVVTHTLTHTVIEVQIACF